jgi:hypothetical protein
VRGRTVLWVPLRASTGQEKPTRSPQRMHAARPFRGSLFTRSGTAPVGQPRARAPAASTAASAFGANGAIG